MIPTIFTFHREPRLTLVGAGPGDPELITLKAINALKDADVVLFDALVSPGILELIPSSTPSLSVGKRAGEHSHTQDEINQMIVELAYLHGHVVRLKGGDPFVFGRGSEEIEYAEAHGVKTNVVPGISSAIAVPASINIPVTARGMSESFWVITGTTKDGQLSSDIRLAAQSKATVVILMGMNRVAQIMQSFADENKGDTPVAIIQNGTLPNEKSIVGTVSSIPALVSIEDMRSPGIIVVGEVVRHARALSRMVYDTVSRNYQ